MRRFAVIAGVVLAPAGLIAAAPSVLATTNVKCGATLKENTTLTSNLSCPHGNGLTLLAGVTLNLGGHRLIGPSSTPATGTGVTLSNTGTSTVTNGWISGGWSEGVALNVDNAPASWTSYVTKIKLTGRGGIRSMGGMLTIKNSTVIGTPGVVIGLGYGGIRNSSFTSTSVTVWDGSATLRRSTLLKSYASGLDAGLLAVNRSHLDGGHVSGLHGASCDNSILDVVNSTISNYDVGIFARGCLRLASGNTLTGNLTGIKPQYGDYGPGGPVTIVGNTFSRNRVGINTEVPATITYNEFSRNTSGLVYTPGEEPAPNVEVTANAFNANTGSGIHVRGATIKLGENISTNNGRYGIYAPGSTDWGNNVAYGNKLAQCVGIPCATH